MKREKEMIMPQQGKNTVAMLLLMGGKSSRMGADKTQLLFTYLTERFTYVPGQSVTPAYSALCEGIADPRGLAMGLTLICQKAGVECWTVSGLRDGEPYFWNIIGDDGDYRHVDLAQSLQNGSLRRMTDWEMNRYYWATAEYPACVAEAPVQEETEETS